MDSFKFKIGDVVCVKVGANEAEMDAKRYPSFFTVIERTLRECPGGIQREYGIQNAHGTAVVNEICLMPHDDPSVIAIKERLRKDREEEQKRIWGDAIPWDREKVSERKS